MKVAAVILNYNSADLCKKCIGDLLLQTNVDLEIVVVDNASRPDDCEKVRALCEERNCTFLAAESNRGYNAGNNIGLRYAAEKGFPYSLICNPDMEFPNRDYLQILVSEMEKDARTAVCGSDIRTPEGIHQSPRRYEESPWYRSFDWIGDIFKRNRSDVPDWIENPETSRFCRGVNGCCLLLRTACLQETGFFDERVFLYGEEAILGRQVELAKWKIYYTASTFAVHHHRKSRENYFAMNNRHWCHSRLHYIKYYSGYPWYGKLFAAFSIRVYFFMLNFSKRHKNGGNAK
ncbi:MAG: glycosyltransferase family 2 protein [Victivallaceae bacterium]|nr:glycosyltransferase family 2 protein [Victivallaceae bacterium]